jgi:CheY-like chemotaxis protein
VVSIRDNGMGIPTDLSPKIFEMFTQADHTMERQHGGLGIGLALVKRLVEMHDGEVSAGANPAGQGSEFLVKLPLMSIPKANESSTSSSATPAKGEAPLRILVVDDNRDSAETLSMLLELMGNEITVAYDGEQALARANEIKPDVVLLDIGLPKMNGYEVARRIRKEPWGSNPILVAITGWGQTEDKELSRESGFDHHLVKPVDHDQLLTLIQKRKN